MFTSQRWMKLLKLWLDFLHLRNAQVAFSVFFLFSSSVLWMESKFFFCYRFCYRFCVCVYSRYSILVVAVSLHFVKRGECVRSREIYLRHGEKKKTNFSLFDFDWQALCGWCQNCQKQLQIHNFIMRCVYSDAYSPQHMSELYTKEVREEEWIPLNLND